MRNIERKFISVMVTLQIRIREVLGSFLGLAVILIWVPFVILLSFPRKVLRQYIKVSHSRLFVMLKINTMITVLIIAV
jgi:hypothetical protein